jgi:hypothetical protein
MNRAGWMRQDDGGGNMRKIAVMLGFLGVIVLRGGASAQVSPVAVTQITDTPAATLLLPYFEVSLPAKPGAKPKGITTFFEINNASATAILAHVTIWTDLAVPVLQFNSYLTGYDVLTINLLDVLNGHLPQTASAGQDPLDAITPKGQFSQDINFQSCLNILPPADLAPATVTDLRNALTGKSSVALGGCGGLDHGDLIARGFVTVDTVNNCTARFPSDAGYFGPGGSGDATNQNTMWGDYYFIDAKKKVGVGDALVHIVASATDPETSVAGQYTFYGRLVGWSAADNRQPLSTTFGARYINSPKGGLFPGGTSAIVWRDPKVVQAAFPCGGSPPWYPLAQEGIVAFDEQEQPEIPAVANAFPAATQRVKINGPTLPVTFPSGWLYLNLNDSPTGSGSNPTENPTGAQAWVSVLHANTGKLTVGTRAVQLDSATAGTHFTP